jgi:hypothetical protein
MGSGELDEIVALFGEEREPATFEGLASLIDMGRPLGGVLGASGDDMVAPPPLVHVNAPGVVDFEVRHSTCTDGVEREETYGPEGIDIVAALRDIYDRLVRQAYREEGVRSSLAQVTGLTLAEVGERLLEYRRRTPRQVLDYYLRFGDWPPTRPSN